jgi:hypothetical protein
LPGLTIAQVEKISRDFDSALVKAPVYSGIAFRGTAASPLWPGYAQELRDLVGSDVAFELHHHLSASVSEEIGVGHCYIEPNDPPREISVLLVARVTSARLLPGFVHRAMDEQEVVLTRGSRFERLGVRQMQSPRPGQEWWRIDLEQVATHLTSASFKEV